MSNPWDPPTLPRRGDAYPEQTWAHVGFTMSRWESLEFELSRVHSLFLGQPDDSGAMQEYGKGRIFPERLNLLTEAAEPHFRRNPCQNREANFEQLLNEARLFAGRRNEVAHGIVFRIDEITLFKEQLKPQTLGREHYALIPPLYAFKPHRATGLPEYSYTSVSLERLCKRLMRLQLRIRALHSGPDSFASTMLPTPPVSSGE